jgi:hypothetical protein
MAIASLFTPVEDILAAQQQQNLLRRQAIAQQGQQFGVFAPLYQAGLQGIENAAQALFPTEDPRLRRATMIQGVLAKYGDMDMTDPTVLASMSKDFAAMGAGREAMMLAQDARKAMREQEQLGLERQRVGLQERGLGLQERGVAVQEGQLGLSKERLAFDLKNLERQDKLTTAQINEINARIKNLDADKFTFIPQKDIAGNLVGVIAVNKTNPEDNRVIGIGGAAATTPGVATDPAAAARAELERRRKNQGGGRSSTSTPEPEVGVSP